MMLSLHNAHVASCFIVLNPGAKRTESTQGSLENVTNISPEAQFSIELLLLLKVHEQGHTGQA